MSEGNTEGMDTTPGNRQLAGLTGLTDSQLEALLAIHKMRYEAHLKQLDDEYHEKTNALTNEHWRVVEAIRGERRRRKTDAGEGG